MSAPPVVALRSDPEVIDVIARLVVVALPCTTRLPVVVAPPDIVSPPACAPLPIVDDANAVRPPPNCVSVEVELPVPWNGYCAKSEDVETLPLKSVQSVEER